LNLYAEVDGGCAIMHTARTSPFTWKIGASIILAMSVQMRVERESVGSVGEADLVVDGRSGPGRCDNAAAKVQRSATMPGRRRRIAVMSNGNDLAASLASPRMRWRARALPQRPV